MMPSSILFLAFAVGLLAHSEAQGGSFSWSGRSTYHKNVNAPYLSKDKKIVSRDNSLSNGIPAKQGCRIRIQQVGICGDADRSSGSVGFTVQGAGGASFGFEAGQNSKGTQIRLPATQRVSGQGARYGGYHKFSETEQKNKYTYGVGKAVNIRSLGTNDPDGLYCQDSNPADGIAMNENQFGSTFRGLVMFTYVCMAPCKSGQFRAKPEDANSCKACTACKDGEEYASGPCISNYEVQLDRKCTKCNPRPGTEAFQRIPCTTYSNNVWGKCTACAEKGEYELRSCTARGDRICLPVAKACNAAKQYEAVAPTRYADRLCLPRTTCRAGQFQVDAGDASTDTACKWLLPPCMVPLQYQTKKPTDTSDRECQPTTECKDTEFESAAPAETTDRKCAPLTVCKPKEVATTAATPTSDRVCALPKTEACKVCAAGFFETRPCNVNLKVEEPTECTACTQCDSDTQVMTQPCTSSRNRLCSKKSNPDRPGAAKGKATKAEMHTASGNVVLRGKDGKNVLVEDLAIMGQDDATAVNVGQALTDLNNRVNEVSYEFNKYKKDNN